MKQENLSAFYWTATLESASAAAKRLDVSQPTISTRIKALEQELGAPLFAHHPFRLNETGRRVLPILTQLLQLEQQLTVQLEPDAQRSVRFRMGVVEAVQHSALGGLVAKLRAQAPKLLLEMMVNTSAELGKQVQQGALDLVISTIPASGRRMQTCSVGSMEMVFVGDAKRHKQRRYTLEQLAGFGFIGFQPGSQPHRHLVKLLKESALEAVVHAVSSVSGMVSLVSAGFGIATLPPLVVESLKRPDLRILPCDCKLPSLPIHISYRIDPSTPGHEQIAQRVIASMRQLLAPKA
jgi:DNA-binding transcriptional LysR family regulator